MVGCIPEVLTLLLTPILTYIHMVYVGAPYMSYMSYITYMTNMISKVIGCIPEVVTLLLTPISTYIHMVYVRATIHVIYVIYVIYDIFDMHDIWHLKCIYISIWVSKEVLGP